MKYLLKIDLLCFDGQPTQDVQTKGAPMIKLSDVKVRAQYRTRVRYRLVVLEYAGERGAAAALRDWETRYNYERFSLALQGPTPAEKLAALHPPQRVA
jgi:hypothetical protein